MSGDDKAYVAPVSGGEWTEAGYVGQFEDELAGIKDKLAGITVAAWTAHSLEWSKKIAYDRHLEFLFGSDTDWSLTLRSDDGRDVPALPDVSGVKLPPQPGAPIVATTPSAYLISGLYEQCDTCRAPVVNPFPHDWRMDLSKEPGERVRLTPHRPDCDAPTPPNGARIPASYVHDLTLGADGWTI